MKRGTFHKQRGFTILELTVVVVIIALINAIAIPALRNTRKEVIATRLANDFRQIKDSLEYALSELGEVPPDRNPGRYPAELEPYLPTEAWRRSVVNARWDWDNWIGKGGRPFQVGLTLRYRGNGVDREVMRMVDEILDDGDLGSGEFREETRFGGYAIVLRENP